MGVLVPSTFVVSLRADGFVALAMLNIDASKIDVAWGGERQDQAPRRSEDAEMPRFQFGAMRIHVRLCVCSHRHMLRFPCVSLRTQVDKGGTNRLTRIPGQFAQREHEIRNNMFSSVEATTDDLRCTNIIEGTSVFVLRFEYHNLFHTATDWYNVYQTARSFAGTEKVNIVFLDGHALGSLDDVWKNMAANLYYIKQLPAGTCFRRALFTWLGYHSALNPILNQPTRQCPKDKMVREFSDVVLRSFGIQPGQSGLCEPVSEPPRFAMVVAPKRHVPSQCCLQAHNDVMMVRRVDYKRRPQHDGRLILRLGNEPEIMSALHQWGDNIPGVRVLEGNFHQMSMKEQLQMVQDACVIVGAHG